MRSRTVLTGAWSGLYAAAAVGAPVLAFAVISFVVSGHARKEYYEAVSQILPVLLLALAVEQRYFSRGQAPVQAPRLPGLETDEIAAVSPDLYRRAARIYALLVLATLGLGEWIAVEVLATGQSSSGDLSITAGSLAAGFTALIVSALVGTRKTA
jgi:hypothetical protein